MKLLSVIVILHNDGSRIELFYHQLVQTLKKMDCNYECIFIDNGSHDDTRAQLLKLCSEDFHFHFISFKHNICIPLACYTAAFYAHGDYIQYMELQHPTYMIKEFYQTATSKGIAMVTGVLYDGEHPAKKQRYFKLFKRTLVLPFMEDEDYDGFKRYLHHTDNTTYWISYHNLEQDQLPHAKRFLHFLNTRYELRMIYLLGLLLSITLFILPTCFIQLFDLDVSYTFYAFAIMTCCICIIIEVLHTYLGAYRIKHRNTQIGKVKK